jgi:hypothetical protein
LTVYFVIWRPLSGGAVHETTALLSRAEAAIADGWPGAAVAGPYGSGVTAAETADGELSPEAFEAERVNV